MLFPAVNCSPAFCRVHSRAMKKLFQKTIRHNCVPTFFVFPGLIKKSSAHAHLANTHSSRIVANNRRVEALKFTTRTRVEGEKAFKSAVDEQKRKNRSEKSINCRLSGSEDFHMSKRQTTTETESFPDRRK